MAQPLKVARGEDYYAASSAATSTTSLTVLFTPNDFDPTQKQLPAGYTAVMVAEEFYVHNLDATNNFYVRPITLTGPSVITPIYPAAGNSTLVSGYLGKQILNILVTSAPAAAATDILVPAGVRSQPFFVRCVGFTIVASVGTPIYASFAFGGLTVTS